MCLRCLELGREELDQVAAAAGIAPLVVVPGQHLDALVADDLGVSGVDDRGIRIGLEVGRDEFFFGVAENSLHRAIRGGLQRGVDGFHGGRLLDEHREVDDADVRRRNAHRVAVELAFECGNDQVQSLGRAGGARNHVERSGASAAKILVRQIEELLIVGVRVDRGHGASNDAERVVATPWRQARGSSWCTKRSK